MKLFYTPKSHFARKVRVLAAALDIPLELVNIRSAFGMDPALFGGSPLMNVPVLQTDEGVILDSDMIAAYLVRQFDPTDRFAVLTWHLDRINTRTVMNGIMRAEVELVLATWKGSDTLASDRLEKMRLTIAYGLAWLEERSDLFIGEPDYLGFHLVCLWDHLVHFGHMPDHSFVRLESHVKALSRLPFICDSQPALPYPQPSPQELSRP